MHAQFLQNLCDLNSLKDKSADLMTGVSPEGLRTRPLCRPHLQEADGLVSAGRQRLFRSGGGDTAGLWDGGCKVAATWPEGLGSEVDGLCLPWLTTSSASIS